MILIETTTRKGGILSSV